jgi:hypothetical protein
LSADLRCESFFGVIQRPEFAQGFFGLDEPIRRAAILKNRGILGR